MLSYQKLDVYQCAIGSYLVDLDADVAVVVDVDVNVNGVNPILTGNLRGRERNSGLVVQRTQNTENRTET